MARPPHGHHRTSCHEVSHILKGVKAIKQALNKKGPYSQTLWSIQLYTPIACYTTGQVNNRIIIYHTLVRQNNKIDD